MSNPEASFDLLFITHSLNKIVDSVSSYEVTVFSYLSCLLTLFDETPASTWGYTFSATADISPFSAELNDALDEAVRRGLVETTAHGFYITGAGEAEIVFLKKLARFEARTQYLEVATNSALAVPLPQVGLASGNEPDLHRARQLQSSRILLSDPLLSGLHNHFQMLNETLPSDPALFTAAITWLMFLSSLEAVDGTQNFADRP